MVISVSNSLLDYESSINPRTDENYCPISFDKGQRLLRKTLANHFKPVYWNLIIENGFYFCPTRDCPVYYFNNVNKSYLGQNDVQTTVMHKMEIGAENRPACYCKNVLESTIFNELLVKKCCDSLIDIQNFTQANTGKDCSITNPTGRCCGKQIREILEWVYKTRPEVETPLMEEAMSCCNKIEKATDGSYQD
ncbi:MAG: hypothetical protein ACW99A_15595 [Candidatus Kariarchaeaceae archaeon]|jgi:hypothetical protein